MYKESLEIDKKMTNNLRGKWLNRQFTEKEYHKLYGIKGKPRENKC